MKTILFDMDGVLVDSELVWEKEEAVLLPSLLGQDVYEAVYPHILGNSIHVIYDLASKAGAHISKDEFLSGYDRCARRVYAQAEIDASFPESFRDLKALGCKVGLASNSPPSWMGCFLARLPNDIVFDTTLSIAGMTGCKPKPAPDIYLRAMKVLDSSPSESVVVEDTQKGIDAGKASGAFTLYYGKYVLGDAVKNADVKIESLGEILSFVNI